MHFICNISPSNYENRCDYFHRRADDSYFGSTVGSSNCFCCKHWFTLLLVKRMPFQAPVPEKYLIWWGYSAYFPTDSYIKWIKHRSHLNICLWSHVTSGIEPAQTLFAVKFQKIGKMFTRAVPMFNSRLVHIEYNEINEIAMISHQRIRIHYPPENIEPKHLNKVNTL